MKFEIFNETSSPEKVTRFKLIKVYDALRLVAVDERGTPVSAGNILEIRPNGTLYRFLNVNSDLGLSRTVNGQVDLSV